MSVEVASLSAVFTANTSNLMSGITQAENRLSGFATNLGSSMQSAGQSMTALGRKATMLSGVMAIPLIAGVKAAIDFESAFAGVVKTVDGTDDQLNTLRDTILQMATDSANPLAGMDDAQVTLARIMELGGQLGVGIGDLEQFTQTIGMLTLATDLTADSASTMLAQFANITGMSFDDFDNLGDTIVALGNNSATTESQIVEFMQRLGGAASSFGFAPAEIAAWAAAMASAGLNAEAGGTAMTQVLTSMAKAAASGGSDLAEFASISGLTAQQFATSWNSDPNLALSNFIQGLSRLDSAARENALVALDLDGIRIADTLRRLSNNTDLVYDSQRTAITGWNESNEAVSGLTASQGRLADKLGITADMTKKQGALEEEAAKRLATTRAQMNLFKNTVNGLAIEIGGILLPALNSLLKDARPLLETFGKFIQDNPQLVKTFTAIAIGVGVLGAVLVPVGMAVSALGGLFMVFGTLLSSAVLGPLLAVGALLGLAYQENFLGLRDAIQSVVDGFNEGGIKGAVEAFVGVLSGIKDAIAPIVKSIGDWAAANPGLVDTLGKAALVLAAVWGAALILSPIIGALTGAFALMGLIIGSGLIIPLGILAALMYGAYTTNFLGFRDAVDEVAAAFGQDGLSGAITVIEERLGVLGGAFLPVTAALAAIVVLGLPATVVLGAIAIVAMGVAARWDEINQKLADAKAHLEDGQIVAGFGDIQLAVELIPIGVFDKISEFLGMEVPTPPILTPLTAIRDATSAIGGAARDAATWLDRLVNGNNQYPQRASGLPGASGTTYTPQATGGIFHANQNLLVGEKGPELVSFPRSGRVTSNNRLNTAPPSGSVGNGGSGSVLNINGGTFVLQGVQNIDDLYAQLQQKAQRTVGAYRP